MTLRDALRTAGVTPEVVAKLTDAEIPFVLAHELTHATLQAQLRNKRIRDLLTGIESDWGFEYSNDTGTEALVKLRRLVGGEPHHNMAYWHEQADEEGD